MEAGVRAAPASRGVPFGRFLDGPLTPDQAADLALARRCGLAFDAQDQKKDGEVPQQRRLTIDRPRRTRTQSLHCAGEREA